MIGPSLRCTAARLSYCDMAGTSEGQRDHQLIEFDVMNTSDNSTQIVRTLPIPPHKDVRMAMISLAQKMKANS